MKKMCLLNILQVKLLFIALIFGTNIFSQQFIFELSPGLKFYGLSFQKTNGVISEGGNNNYAFADIKHVGSYENISYTNKYSLEPELNLAFFKLNNNWKFSLGISTFIVKSKINATTTGKTYLPYADSSTIFTEYISKQLINRYNQFSLFVTKTFFTNKKLDKILLNSFSVGLALNEPSRFNTRNEKEFYESYLYNHYGYEKAVTFKKSSFGFLTPLAIFKYDIQIQNGKNNFGILNLNISYLQGFSKHNTFVLNSSSVGGASLHVESINKGSGLRIGISKTFSYHKREISPVSLE